MKSSKHNRLTGTLFRRYLVQCIFWAAALIVAGTLFDFIIQRLPMFYQERWYMSYRTLYVGCAGVALWALVVLFLTYRLLKRAAGFIDEVQIAAHQVASDSDELITLSPELTEIAVSLNALKQESLHTPALQQTPRRVKTTSSCTSLTISKRPWPLSSAICSSCATSPPFQKKRARATWPQPCARPSGSMR